ncbi:MAG: cell division protein FtsZ [Pseudomonadota bacterium]
MTLNLSMPGQDNDLRPRITVFGVGGAGGNAVNNMIEKRLDGVDFVVANTDAQALAQSEAEERIQLGVKVTEGLGAGAKAAVGAAAAEENIEQIVDQLAGAHMCFITAGMGGGTGTGAAPIIAQAARELGVLTVGVVTKPFQFEGAKRMRQAEEGVEALQKMVDTLIIIPNQNLFRLANEKTTFTEAFSMADDVLYQGVKGVTDLMVRPGLINLDFADVRAVMDEMGKAMMGTGEDSGEERAIQAAEKAIANPLLDEISLRGARGVLINITGGYDLTLFELDEAANRIREEVDAEANIIVGSTLDPEMEGVMRVSVVATGIDASQEARDIPLPRRSMAEPLRPTMTPEMTPETSMPPVEAPVEVASEASPDIAAAQESAVDTADVADDEPNLFDGFDAHAVAAQTAGMDDEMGGTDMPEPAYRPAEEAEYAGHQEFDGGYADVGGESLDAQPTYAAASADAPSHDALARLQAAVQKTGMRRTATAPADPVAAEDADDKPRFRINSLINRMTGHQAGAEANRPARQQPPVQSAAAAPQAPVSPSSDARSEEEEQIEIPAFLRRQAN